MRVGLVCPYDLSIPGGVQAQVLGLSSHLADAGVESVVVGPNLPADIDGVDVGPSVSVPGNGSKVPIAVDPRTISAVKKALSDTDVVHVHEPLMPLVSLAALRSDKPVVATFHAAPGEFGRRAYNLMGGSLKRLLGPNVAVITAVSHTARSVIPKDMEVLVVPNGVDVGEFSVDVDRRPTAVCFLGRDEPRKGLDILLAAWPGVLAEVPSASLDVMGADRATPGIKWHGLVSDGAKAEILASSAVYVAPHTGGESFGIVLVEAMAAGAAVVASDLEAFVDVADGVAAFFSVGDPNELAARVVQLLTNEGQLHDAEDKGRVRAAEFDWSSVAQRYVATYEQALS